VVGAKPGEAFVSGDEYIKLSYDFHYSNVWKNLGISVAFFVLFTITSALAVEYKKPAATKSEFLVFRKGSKSAKLGQKPQKRDLEHRHRAFELNVLKEEKENMKIERSNDVFCWQHVNYDIEIKGAPRRLLDNVQGFVEPGTLTALVGSSGAGKTTLLNVLAQRVSTGVISGDMLVNGSTLDRSFQRRTGYVQQQDVHLAELTVRESFRFSALLRQGKEVPVAEKYAYVENIITALGMQHYADAVIGTPEEGLSAEKRKRITIGLELVAKPTLLLFLDEPTSGLDSQSASSIIKFLRQLADAGQAILCTIHQPSATLFEEFDRLLVLSRGGRTAYFGDLGKNSRIVTSYFERNGAPACDPTTNSAEYILDVVGAGAQQTAIADWAEVWKSSPECAALTKRINHIRSPGVGSGFQFSDRLDSKFQFNKRVDPHAKFEADKTSDFATSWFTQFYAVLKRLFQQHWRSPVYLNSKFLINVFGGLFLGFTFFHESTSIQGLQNKTFAVFMFLLLCLILIVLLQPRLLVLRDLYEVRERHSKMYHWTTL
jgi:ABC-type multidrug transport system ATPase subunit